MTKSSNSFLFSNPETGELLNISEICGEEKIVVEEDVMSTIKELDDEKEEFIISLTKQGIDVFNISDRFYNDICYHFESPNAKDVPMKDRIIYCFPNITLCDSGCENKGVDLDTMKAKCECIFKDLMNPGLMDNVYAQSFAEIVEIFNSININVVKCFRDIFVKENFINCIGGYFLLGLLFGQLLSMLKFIYDGLYFIRKYIFSLTEAFQEYIKKNPNIFQPPKKQKLNSILLQKNETNSVYNSSKMILSHKNSNNSNKHMKQSAFHNKNKLIIDNNSKSKSIRNKVKLKGNKIKIIPKNNKNSFHLKTEGNQKNNKSNGEYMNKIKELFSQFDENDFDDVLDQDKRTFCEYFWEKFKNNQIFINTFFINEIFRPKALKCIIFIMTIELYFVINALFYNEEYLSELFNSDEEELFFSFVKRRFNQFIYTSAVSGIISYLIGYFFVEEIKLKKIFMRNKKEEMKMKYELSTLAKTIENRFIGLIIFSISLTIICFVYISCFNIVYPYIKLEWIKSSLFILILMQLINFLITFLESSIRFLAISCNSKKMFSLSLWLS
jgi:hypothetical protein